MGPMTLIDRPMNQISLKEMVNSQSGENIRKCFMFSAWGRQGNRRCRVPH